MKLTKVAILALRGLDHEAKRRIGEAADVEVSTVYRWIRDNSKNLTQPGILDAISREIALPRELILDQAEAELR